MDRVMMNEGSKDHAVDVAVVVVGQTEGSHCPSQHHLPNQDVVSLSSEVKQLAKVVLESVLRHQHEERLPIRHRC